jgi:hypothetical protein
MEESRDANEAKVPKSEVLFEGMSPTLSEPPEPICHQEKLDFRGVKPTFLITEVAYE